MRNERHGFFTYRILDNDWIALPFTLMWQISLFMAPMLFVVQAMTVFWVTLAVFVVGLAGMTVFWYKKLPADNVVTQRIT